jgi:phage pi2 protein 07
MISVQQSVSDEDASHETTEEQFVFDTVLVFGEGPVKPILLPEQLTPEQYREFDLFNSDPMKYPEPNFWLMQQPRNLAQIQKINERKDISQEEKDELKEKEIQKWQHKGWYALKRMGRQNALAAGLALYKGITKEVIVSGGQTVSPWAKEHMPKERLENWPTEAELMAEVIKSSYGALYEKKYGRKIDDVIRIENAATNTLENFSYSVNKFPHLLQEEKKIGFLSAGHHMKRLKLLAQIFGIPLGDNYGLASQQLLKDAEEDLMCEIIDEHNCTDTKEQFSREERWIKALSQPEYVTYWLGYVAEVEHMYVLQKAIDRFRDESWRKAATTALSQVSIDIDEVVTTNLETLAKTNPQKFVYLVSALKQLKQPAYRILPPVEL